MGIGIYPKLDRELPGVNAVDGKRLAAEYFDSLERDGLESPFAPIGKMFSVSPGDASDFATGEGVDAELPEPEWHDAGDGVEAIDATIRRLRERNSASPAIADLEQIKAVLLVAAREGLSFYLTCDLP